MKLYTHAAIVIDELSGTDVIPATSEAAALAYLRERATLWEGRSVLQDLDLSSATLEELNLLYTDGEQNANVILIGNIEASYDGHLWGTEPESAAVH